MVNERKWEVYDEESIISYISESELRSADEDEQASKMEAWFRINYVDPAGENSFEGQYYFFNGGPYDPLQVLMSQFEDVVPNEVIEKLASKLSYECSEWDGNPDFQAQAYDFFLLDNIGKTTGFFDIFNHQMTDITILLNARVDVSVQLAFHRMLYANSITAMETYLSDAFTSVVLSDKKYIRKFVETNPEFKKETFAQSSLFEQVEKIEDRVKMQLLDTIWHKLYLVLGMFESVFDIKPLDGAEGKKRKDALIKAVSNRHDIVHRYGKSKTGDELILNEVDVIQLLREIQAFIIDIDKQLSPHTEGLRDLSFVAGQKRIRLQ